MTDLLKTLRGRLLLNRHQQMVLRKSPGPNGLDKIRILRMRETSLIWQIRYVQRKARAA